jgi:hypothetical protein
VKLGVRHSLLIEVSEAEDKEMACGVVVGRGVAGDIGAPQFVDVALAVDAYVIGDVDPAVLVLVVSLILSEAVRSIAVIAEDDRLMVEGQTGDGLALSAGAGRSRTPRVSA